MERKKRNEAVCVYGYRRPLYIFSLSLSLFAVGHRRTKGEK